MRESVAGIGGTQYEETYWCSWLALEAIAMKELVRTVMRIVLGFMSV
jgi:hypothetical protein